jgi:molybdopterin biosynthesis enzyme
MLRKVELGEAIGMTLAHDVTKVIPGKFKGPGFRRGHVIQKEDIPELLRIGKEHVYVLELEQDEVHEEEAALRIARAIAGPGIESTAPVEGRVNLKAKIAGLLKIDVPLLEEINSLGEITVATLHSNTMCKTGTVVAGAKITPLVINEDRLRKVEQICQTQNKIIDVIALAKKKIGIVITGNEVFQGRIEDKYGEVMQRKAKDLGSEIIHKVIVPDDTDMIAQALAELKAKGAEVIVACGGLSVDPDDVTVAAVKKAGAEIVSYGAPVMPGAMFLYAMWQGIPLLGAQAAVIYSPVTILDLILPRILAGDKISRMDIAKLGHGGLIT